MDKPPTPILDSKDTHLEPTSSLTSNSSGNLISIECDNGTRKDIFSN